MKAMDEMRKQMISPRRAASSRFMLNESCVRLRVLSRRRRDDAFLARLIADPRETVEEETGLRFPDDYRLHVHEESVTVRFSGRCEK